MKIDELIRDLKYTVLHLPWSEIRKDADRVVARVEAALKAQQTRIAQLEAELKEEMYRHDRVQDFEVAEAQELAKLREERRWIPVEERLPEDDPSIKKHNVDEKLGFLTVLVHNGVVKQSNRYLCGEERCGLQKTNGWEWASTNVTHWMPLPKPPEVDG